MRTRAIAVTWAMLWVYLRENRSEFIDVKDDFTVVAAINRLNPFAPTAAYANELPPAGNSGNADYSTGFRSFGLTRG